MGTSLLRRGGWLVSGGLLLALLQACGGGGSLGLTTGGAEPTGGRWRTLVLASGETIAVPAPDPSVLGVELAELLRLQNERTAEQLAIIAFWDGRAVVQWNAIARQLVIDNRTSPPAAARDYAMLSAAQYDALVSCWNARYRFARQAPTHDLLRPAVTTSDEPSYPSEHAALAAVSAAVLSYCYPAAADFLAERAAEHSDSRLWAGVNFRSDLEAGRALGLAVAEQVTGFCRTDGADAQIGRASRADGVWSGIDPLLPDWAQVRPWLLTAADQFRPVPPPVFGSAEFLAGLAEVRQISDARTAEQLRIAQFWADGAGTATPPGHWNQIACDLIEAHGLNELRAARALALLNLAVADAGISCWDAKFTYWLIRPSQADPAITVPVGLPNFPSYTSGHSTFSGAAAAVLGYLFPSERAALEEQAHEASVSRLYGGIHYRFDCDAGIAAGEQVGGLAIARGQADGAP